MKQDQKKKREKKCLINKLKRNCKNIINLKYNYAIYIHIYYIYINKFQRGTERN